MTPSMFPLVETWRLLSILTLEPLGITIFSSNFYGGVTSGVRPVEESSGAEALLR